jgi:putative redox protein
MSETDGIVASAVLTMRATHYAVDIRVGRHALIADEPKGSGGADAGPSPFDLLLSSLGACTAITLRMYCERKQWPLGNIEVRLTYRWQGETPAIERTLTLAGLDEAQRVRCAEIAEKTPVTRALRPGIAIHTKLQ